MNKPMTFLAFGAAFIGMGIAMPQCPGEKALQDQVDTLTKSNMQLTQKINKMDSQLQSMFNEIGLTKQFATQMTATVTEQKGALDRLDAAVKDLQAKAAAAKPAAKGKTKAHKGK